MSIKSSLKKIRDNYVINQVQQAKLPDFVSGETKRMEILFSGRVQKVGFRLEVCEMAKRLDLTGWCRNLENGDVLAQMQGPENKIQYLISFMESLVRIKIRKKTITELEVLENETGFERK